ncbi:MAG: cupin domain-containing protein [Actinomycetes bacterium]
MTDTPRTFVVSARTVALEPDPLDPAQVVSGSPEVSVLEILSRAVAGDTVSVGVWQHTAGVSTDVEADEVFVVLSGRATVEVDGGPTLQVGPGDVGVLSAGTATRWTIHEDLRKVYLVTG